MHIRFTKKDPDLCRWKHSIDARMLSFYINNILLAELLGRTAYLPQIVSLSADESPCDMMITPLSADIESFWNSIPHNKRSNIIKEIIRKHLRAQSNIRKKNVDPFAENVLISSGNLPDIEVKTAISTTQKPKKNVNPESLVKPTTKSKPIVEEKEESEEEREMRMALIAMAGE